MASGKNKQIYSGLDTLPTGHASRDITPGCLVLEGGAWRGVYTQGALDALMEAGINFQTTIGVSAGAMSAIGYLAGQIGWSARINLTYRHDPQYCGAGAVRRDHGVTGFSYLFDDLMGREVAFNEARFKDPSRRLVAVAANIETGEAEYFEKGSCNIFRAVRASATVPYVSRPVVIKGQAYLDGGCAVKIPYDWAVQQGFEKIMVIRTQDRDFRRKKKSGRAEKILYERRWPKLAEALIQSSTRYNEMIERLNEDEAAGKIFVLAPAQPMELSRFEGDMEKLGDRYWRGYNEMKEQIPALREYLAR